MRRPLRSAVLVIVLLLAFAGAVVWMMVEDARPSGRLSPGISAVVYGGDNSDRWKSLDQGIGQACSELNIEKPVLSTARASDPDTLVRTLRREVENGAQGLLIAASDDARVAAFLRDELPSGIPFVLMEEGAGDHDVVAADYARMGRDLADIVAAQEGTVALLAEGLGRRGVAERHAAFLARMGELGRAVHLLERGSGDELTSFIASSLAASRPPVDILVALDTYTLETAIDAAPASMIPVRLYGMGNSNRVVHAVDQGALEAVIFQDEYAIGYIALMRLAAKMGLAQPTGEVTIPHRTVHLENLFDPDIERLLFPTIQ